MLRLAASVKIFPSSYGAQKSAQQDYCRNKDSKRQPGDLLSCFALKRVLFYVRWSVWICLFESLRRDGILSASHFTTHRNHPTEDDDQDPPNEMPGNSNDGGGTGEAAAEQTAGFGSSSRGRCRWHTVFISRREPAATIPRTTQLCGKRQKVTSLWVWVTKRVLSSRPQGWKIDTHLLHFTSYPLIFFLSLYFSLFFFFFLLRTQDWGHGTGNGWSEYQ